MYSVRVQWSPACEFVLSLLVVADSKLQRTVDVDKRWREQALQGLPEDVRAVVSEEPSKAWAFPPSIAHISPAGDVTGFMTWLAALSPGDLYATFAALYPDERIPQPIDLEARRDKFMAMLEAWNSGYFAHLDARILDALKADAEEKRSLAARVPAQQVIEEATNGLLAESTLRLEFVTLTPQFHYRPLNVIDVCGTNAMVYFYPIELPDSLSCGVPQRLLRMGNAISDPTRLKILGFLKSGPHTFTEITRFLGMYKSTVHYHLVILRSAGLLSLHMSGAEIVKFSLRPQAAAILASAAKSFLEVER